MSLINIYPESPLLKKIELQRTTNHNIRPVCLFSDLDDSYIMKHWPTEEVLAANTQKYTDTILSSDISLYQPTVKLKEYLDERNVPLVIVSGRDMYQMNELIRAFSKLMPESSQIMNFDAIIGAVGTEIYLRVNNEYVIDREYEQLFKNSPFKREAVFGLLDGFIPKIRDTFKPVAFDFSKRDMPGSTQELPPLPYKISLEFKSDYETSEKIKNEIISKLKENNLESIQVLMSCPYAISANINKYNIDIVPFAKDKPISYLKKLLNVTSVVAADSGNDLAMITESADYAIIVGNAKKELTESIAKLSPNEKQHIYLASHDLQGPKAILTALINYLPDR